MNEEEKLVAEQERAAQDHALVAGLIGYNELAKSGIHKVYTRCEK